MILAIDPGTVASGWVLIDPANYRPGASGKTENWELLELVHEGLPGVTSAAIEMMASYGMPVGREVLETCTWIGRFEEALEVRGIPATRIYRRDEKLTLCGSPRANDATIRQSLIDRFAYNVPNHGKGTKQEPGFFYGFKADIWQAYAVGVTYLDRLKEGIA